MLINIFKMMAEGNGYQTPNPHPPITSILEGAIVVCDGNSLTQGYGSTQESTDAYPAVLSTLDPLPIYNVTVVNKGVSGQTTQQMTDDATTDIDPLYSFNVTSILVAWEMGNDLYFNGDVEGAKTRFRTYCETRKQIGWTVIVLSLPAREHSVVAGGVSPAGDNDVTFNIKREQLNDWLRSTYFEFADILVDLDADERFATFSTTYFNSDKVHLNTNGYHVVAEMLLDAILSLDIPIK
jgi:lysophospholipase L1-like esterase